MKKNNNTDNKLDKLLSFMASRNCNEDEIWKEVNNTDGKYLVSDNGYVLSLCNYPTLLNQYIRNGYYTVKINGKNRTIHQLVAEHFIDKEIINNKSLLVHHKDRNKLNNKLSNLQVMTYKEHNKIHNQKRGSKDD